MRMSNEELQEAINSAIDHLKEVKCVDLKRDIAVHVRMLLSEQRRRAHDQVEFALEPMETTVEQAEFDARVRAQEPPWVEWEGGKCPVGVADSVEVKFRDGLIERSRYPWTWAWSKTGKEEDIIAYRNWTKWEAQK